MVIYFIDIQFNTESSVDLSLSVCNKYSVKYERWQLIDQDSDDIECWLREGSQVWLQFSVQDRDKSPNT